jgi:DNA invertase Pin-like site-specific DNA recombinase
VSLSANCNYDGENRLKRCGLYLRVSSDTQTVENQLLVLNEVAERSGWTIVQTFADEGISGAKGGTSGRATMPS